MVTPSHMPLVHREQPRPRSSSPPPERPIPPRRPPPIQPGTGASSGVPFARRPPALPAWLAAIATLALFLQTSRPATPPTRIHAISDLVALRRSPSPDALPLDLRASCWFIDRAWGSLWLADSNRGFWTDPSHAPTSLVAGLTFDLRGKTRPGSADIDWEATTATPVATRPLPLPQRPPELDLSLPDGGDLWAELEGVVRRVHYRHGHVVLEFIVDHRVCEINLPTTDSHPDLTETAEIRARGVLVHADRYAPPGVSLKLFVPDSRHLLVLAPDHRRHFEAPLLDPPGTAMPPAGSHARLRGRLLHQQPGKLTLQHPVLGTCSIASLMISKVPAGTELEAVGILHRSATGETSLHQALYRLPRLDTLTDRLSPLGPANPGITPTNPDQPLATLGQVRRLTRPEAAQGRRVKVQAQVLADFTPLGWDILFVQDQTGASYVRSDTNQWHLTAGDHVLIEGRTEVSTVGIFIRDAHVQSLQPGTLPAPLRTSLGHLQLASEDCRWVEIEGWVRQATVRDHVLVLDLCDGTGRLPVFVATSDTPLGLRDAIIRVRGAAGARTDATGQLLGMTLFAPPDHDLVITTPAPQDPFDFPTTPISALRAQTAQPFGLQRVKIQGTVTAQSGSSLLFVQDAEHAVAIRPWEPCQLPPGSRIEAVGIPTWGPPMPELKMARLRTLGTAPLPTPQTVRGTNGFGPNHPAARCTVEGVLASVSRLRDSVILDFKQPARLDARCQDSPAAHALLDLPPGSRLRLTGALECLPTEEPTDGPHEHHLFLASTDDVTVIARGPWWDRRYGYALLAAIALVLAIAVAWVRSLRQLVRFQTAEITHELVERRQAEQALRGSLREKEALLREIHHRVKNNLQIVSSLLSLQSLRVDLPQVREALADTQGRVRSMALLHEALYRSGNLAQLDVASYLHNLVAHLQRSMPDTADRVRFHLDIAPVHLDLDRAVPCGVIINELLTNSLKHAFPNRRSGLITLRLAPVSEDHLNLQVSDDGVGLPNSQPRDPAGPTSLGLLLVGDLVRQLGGEHQLDSTPDLGTTFTMAFPRTAPRR